MQAFSTRFALATLASTVLILLIWGMKKCFIKHISIRWQYNIDLLSLLLLAIPLVPTEWLGIQKLSLFEKGSHFLYTPSAATSGASIETTSYSTNWLNDFSMSVERSTDIGTSLAFLTTWIVGILVFSLVTHYCNRDLRIMKESAKSINNREITALFNQCAQEVGMRATVALGASILVQSPITIGFFRKMVIIPESITREKDAARLRHIFLHELTHCTNKDIPLNNLMCLLQILYWFNPVVYLIFRETRRTRELACDAAVLKRLITLEERIHYGMTLLSFTSSSSFSHNALSFSTMMGAPRKQMKRRIMCVASFSLDSTMQRLKSICAFALVGILVLFQASSVAAMNALDESIFDFHLENIIYEDLSDYFGAYDGSFVLYDSASDLYSIHNAERSMNRVSPASTYKIYSALIALDAGVIDTVQSTLPWDGKHYPFDTWEQDHNLSTAMRNSVNWYFESLDKSVGEEGLSDYFTKIQYGNCDLSGGMQEYWLESSLRISPIEQVMLLSDLYLNNSMFHTAHVDAMKDVLYLEEKDGATLSGKTGTGTVNGQAINGWFIGTVEKNGQQLFFATNIQGESGVEGSTCAEITLSILDAKGIY